MTATMFLLFITGDRSAHMSKANGVRSTYVSVRQGQSNGPGGVASHQSVLQDQLDKAFVIYDVKIFLLKTQQVWKRGQLGYQACKMVISGHLQSRWEDSVGIDEWYWC